MKKLIIVGIAIWVCFSKTALAAGPEQDELVSAIMSSNEGAVHAILADPEKRKKIDLNERDASGWPTLAIAAVKGNPKVVKELLESGADSSKGVEFQFGRRKLEMTPFMLSAQENQLEIMRTFLTTVGWTRENLGREWKLAFDLKQDNLKKHLELVWNSVRSTVPRGDEEVGCVIKHFMDDLPAVALEEDFCAICKSFRGSNGSKKLLNGKMKAGRMAEAPCGHCFCAACVKPWIEQHGHCPTCRGVTSLQDLAFLNEEIQDYAWLDQAPKVPLPWAQGSSATGAAAGTRHRSSPTQRSAQYGIPLAQRPMPTTQEEALAEIEELVGPVHDIAGGAYMKGPGAGEQVYNADPRPNVTVQGFGMQENQISQRQYELVMGTGYRDEIRNFVRNKNFTEAHFMGPNKPILLLTRAEEDDYMNRLNARLRQLWVIAHPGEVFRPFRKPTDDEREYVTTSPDGRHQKFPVNPMRRQREWSEGPYDIDSTELQANARGIKGFGNIWEPTSDHFNGDPDRFVLRGGSWENGPELCRSASRFSVGSGYRGSYVGLRLVR